MLHRLRQSPSYNYVFIFFSLLLTVAIFELLPAVDRARQFFPSDFENYDCSGILKNRPWYGQVNTWMWLWLIFTPIVVFSATPNSPKWYRASRTIFAIGVSYVFVNLATHLGIEIRNAPFHGEGIAYFNGERITSEADEFKFHCFDIADGARYVGALLFGWVYAVIYHGWWEGIWHQYHKRVTKQMDKNFKTDFVNIVVVFFSIALPAGIAAIIIWKA